MTSVLEECLPFLEQALLGLAMFLTMAYVIKHIKD